MTLEIGLMVKALRFGVGMLVQIKKLQACLQIDMKDDAWREDQRK